MIEVKQADTLLEACAYNQPGERILRSVNSGDGWILAE